MCIQSPVAIETWWKHKVNLVPVSIYRSIIEACHEREIKPAKWYQKLSIEAIWQILTMLWNR